MQEENKVSSSKNYRRGTKQDNPWGKVHCLQELNLMHVCPIHLSTVGIFYGFPQLFQTNNSNEPTMKQN